MRFSILYVSLCVVCLGATALANPPPDRLLDLVVIPDVNGNSSSELVAFVSAPLGNGGVDPFGPDPVLYVRDPISGDMIGDYPIVNPGWNLLSLVGVREGRTAFIGTLQQHENGAIRVVLRNPATGTVVRIIPFLDDQTAVSAAFIPNAGGRGIPGVAMLSVNAARSYPLWEEIIVEVRRVSDGALLNKMYYQFQSVWDYGTAEPLAIAAVADENGNGINEIAVLGHTYAIAIVARDAKTGEHITPPGNIDSGAPALIEYFNRTSTPIGFAPVGDASGDGQSEVAVLGLGKNGRSRLQSREVMSGAPVINPLVFGSNWKPRIVRRLGDVNGNGTSELAVAGVRNDGRVTVKVLDGGTGTIEGNVNFFPGTRFDPRDLAILRDISGNGIDELALIGRNPINGRIRIQIRDAQTGRNLRNIDLPYNLP